MAKKPNRSSARTAKARPEHASKELSPEVLRAAALRRVPRRTGAQGRIAVPALPGLLDHYVDMLRTIFQALQRPFSDADGATLRQLLGGKIDEVYRVSSYGSIRIEYSTRPPPDPAIDYSIYAQPATLGQRYAEWIAANEPPLFGTHPDARIMALLDELGPPEEARVLDIGAGTGRNALPIARRGFRVEAVEPTPALAQMLRESSEREGLSLRVVEGDLAALGAELEAGYRLWFLAEVVTHMRSAGELRAIFERAAQALLPGGYLLFNAFVPVSGYTPDRVARELSQMFWCSIFTHAELAQATRELPLELVADDSVIEYERTRLPQGAFPPTRWFVPWSQGADVYDVPLGRAPVEFRWLLYRRT